MSDEPQTTKQPADWEAIERDYRAGLLSLREIGSLYGITEGAIRKRAKRDGWVRDLTERIQQRADELVRKDAVRTEVRKTLSESEKQVIEASAEVIANVRREHRKDIARARAVLLELLGEVEHAAGRQNAALLSELGDAMRRPDDKGNDRLNDIYQRVISLPSRVKAMKDVAEALRVLIVLEREAYGLEAKGGGDDPADTPAAGRTHPRMTDAERAVRLHALLAAKSVGGAQA